MTKVEINGKTYCVETLIYEVERLTKDVKASAEYHRSVLDKIKDYVDHIRNTGMGKKKSLEYIEKFIEGLKAESEG